LTWAVQFCYRLRCPSNPARGLWWSRLVGALDVRERTAIQLHGGKHASTKIT